MADINKITNADGNIRITLDVYIFLEGDCYIAYSPALDMSGYGESERLAKESFSIAIDEYVKYARRHKTLVKDLKRHGWKVRSLKQRKMSAPSLDEMLASNAAFKEILVNKEYRKVSEPFLETA